MNRDDAIKILNTMKLLMCRPDGTPISDGYEALEMAIESLKTEPIECKDCKWYGHIGCAIKIVDDSDKPKANDYCSFGERREP